MNQRSISQVILVTATLFALPVSQAAMSKPDYKADKARIGVNYKADKKACSTLTANAKDICVQEAKAKEKVAYAELEYAYTGNMADQNKVKVVKADTAYAVAKERCDDAIGNKKDVCVKEAKAVHVKALAEAKMVKVVGATAKDNANDVADAQYKVAAEKCDAMSGDAKAACISAAKMKFGKR